MRGAPGERSSTPSSAPTAPQGLTLRLRHKQMRLKIASGGKDGGSGREVSERKQVGDAESMVNEGKSVSGRAGLFGENGEV